MSLHQGIVQKIQETAALAACSCLANQLGLETLRTLVSNIAKNPQENKYRSVSLAALEKRGLTLECREFLQSVGFTEEQGRLCFHNAVSIELLEGLEAIEDILRQSVEAQKHMEAAGHSKSPAGSVANDQESLQQARLAALARTRSNAGAGSATALVEAAGPVLDNVGSGSQPQQLGNPEVESMLVEMGFPLGKVQEVLHRVQDANNVDDVLPELLAMMEHADVGQEPNQPALWPAVSAVSLVSESPDVQRLERDMSGTSRQVLESVSKQALGSLTEVARLLLSIEAAIKQGLIEETQQREFYDLLLVGRVDIVQEIIVSLAVSAMPEMLLPQGEASWQCLVCLDQQYSYGWECPMKHRFCRSCMQQHVDAVAFPRCPMCDYSLGESDFKRLSVPLQRLEAFRDARLRGAVDTLAKSDECLIRCARAECSNVVILEASGRQMFTCSVCDAAPFCTRCRQAPYHFHASCSRVQPLREQWLAWISGGRDEYHGRQRRAVENDRRNQALYEGIQRHNELEADERWKAENCRLCPKCSRPISKVEGCDSMVCGRAYHGGDQQPGCGHEFDWAQARPYEAHVRRRELPRSAAESRFRGRDTFHPFTDCSICGAQGLAGLRFRCLHCEEFDVCSTCEPRLGDLHQADHVFEILFESDFKCPWLPRNTRVRIVRSGTKAPKCLNRCSVRELEGLAGVVTGRRRLPLEAYFVELELGQGTVELDPEFLEPVVTSRESAEQLLLRTLEEDGEEPTSGLPSASGAAPAPHDEFDDDSPLSSEEEVPRRLHLPQHQIRRPLAYIAGGGRLGGRRGGRGVNRRRAVPVPHESFEDDSPLSSSAEEVPRRRRLSQH